jgi:hypothetical protein
MKLGFSIALVPGLAIGLLLGVLVLTVALAQNQARPVLAPNEAARLFRLAAAAVPLTGILVLFGAIIGYVLGCLATPGHHRPVLLFALALPPLASLVALWQLRHAPLSHPILLVSSLFLAPPLAALAMGLPHPSIHLEHADFRESRDGHP